MITKRIDFTDSPKAKPQANVPQPKKPIYIVVLDYGLPVTKDGVTTWEADPLATN